MPPSNYSKLVGDGFFLLSDASYGSQETALVRLEVPEGGGGRLREYGGVDIAAYRIPNALAFLNSQKNLHRVDVKGRYAGEGLANTLSYLWDNWYKKSRRSWQRVLSTSARTAETKEAPKFKMGEAMAAPTQFENNPQFGPMPGYELVTQFRYPLWQAKPIAPPANTALEGSSSNFTAQSQGNVMVPLGKLKPGLYLVEAVIGSYRANTLLFISDTIAVTKNASDQMLVWTAARSNGKPIAGVATQWTDGTGVLKSGSSDADGVLKLDHASPEHTYVFGQDAAGGVFISENYYYDSEIYNTKLYAVTDRPLYRPGDEVAVKIFAREFKSARVSVPVPASELTLAALDPSGTPVANNKLRFTPEAGAETRFRLPDNATAGGYELRIGRGDDQYAAAFRVAEYVKPHFDINVLLDKPSFKTGEEISGHLELRYPDGKPVANAHVTVNVRAQQTSMVEGELRYAGLFPVKLSQEELESDAQGNVKLSLPPAGEPSRYVLTLLANDNVAYRVRVTRELLVERGLTAYALRTDKRFSQPGENVQVQMDAQGQGGSTPATWEILRLENRARTTGKLAAGARSFPVSFGDPGSYTVNVRDAAGNLLGALSHWVAGEGLKAAPGKVEIVFDRERYQPGDTAEALITFPEPVEQALLTLERDRVEQHALLSGARWVETKKVAPSQWKARIKVGEELAPNVTFSVLYVRNGSYVFDNAGIKVAQPAVNLAFTTPKQVYLPGETVTVEVQSQVGGKPVSADVAVGVIDEMVYVLQPEIAPDIFDFFFHPRRDNVRTNVSLNFIGYDLARAYGSAGDKRRAPANERAVKVLERPRRDEVDTAAWQPSLRTDAGGHARFSFVMPDSLTRWRITGRAMTAEGLVGQRTSYIRSDKSFYVKWTGPTRFREQDSPEVALVAFNQTEREQEVQMDIAGAGLTQTRKLMLKRGANYVLLPVNQISDGDVTVALAQNGQSIDKLSTHVSRQPLAWTSPRQLNVPLSSANTPLQLPADARNIRLNLLSGADAQFQRVVDELIDYPYGCIEQTSSRLIPLTLAYQAMNGTPQARLLDQRLHTQRQRLVQLAGNNGVFGWWGWQSRDDLFLSAYAYYADWYAGRALGITLPDEHWQRLLPLYEKEAGNTPLAQRALVLWWMNEIGLPVATLLAGVDNELRSAKSAAPVRLGEHDGLLLAAPHSEQGRDVALLLSADLHRSLKTPLAPDLAAFSQATAKVLAHDASPFVHSLLLQSGLAPADETPGEVLAKVSADGPTLERAMSLVWLQKAMGGKPGVVAAPARPSGNWQGEARPSGATQWRWNSPAVPTQLALASPPATGLVAQIRYDSTVPETAKLPLNVSRKLYRLVPVAEKLSFKAVPLAENSPLEVDALYVDEVTLTPSAGKGSFSYGLLEVPLPPGGAVESTSWGLKIEGLSDQAKEASQAETAAGNFQRPTFEMGELSYRIPFEKLDGARVVRQLVRFSARGQYQLPSARFFRMYQPDQKAFEAQASRALTVQ